MSDPKVTQGFLVDTRTKEKLLFQYNPKPIKDRKAMVVTSTPIPGVYQPRTTPSHGGERKITFTLDFHAMHEDSVLQDVQKKIDFLYSLEAPHDGGIIQTHQAPVVMFVYGKMYRLAVYVERLDVAFDHRFGAEDLLPWYATVSVTLVPASRSDMLAKLVRHQRGAFYASY